MTNAPVVRPPEPPAPETFVCANCHAPLHGEHCSVCGQRHEPRIHSVVHFAGEAFESITHADSRLWRTLWFLLARPGFLTREFFAGHRSRYLPPFRLYLVISVAFFLVVGLSHPGDVHVVSAAGGAERIASMNEVARALETELAGTPGAAAVARAVREQAARDEAALDDKTQPAKDETDNFSDEFSKGMQENNIITEFCKEFEQGVAEDKASRNYQKLAAFCSKTAADRGKALVEAVVHSIPRAMFVFLPMLALVMKMLYWRPKRYYVEHLLFLVHNHAFVFLALAIISLLNLIPAVRDYTNLPELAVWLYIAWYVYRAMRVYYAQGRALTLAKYFIVGIAYLSTSLAVLMLTAIFAMFLL